MVGMVFEYKVFSTLIAAIFSYNSGLKFGLKILGKLSRNLPTSRFETLIANIAIEGLCVTNYEKSCEFGSEVRLFSLKAGLAVLRKRMLA